MDPAITTLSTKGGSISHRSQFNSVALWLREEQNTRCFLSGLHVFRVGFERNGTNEEAHKRMIVEGEVANPYPRSYLLRDPSIATPNKTNLERLLMPLKHLWGVQPGKARFEFGDFRPSEEVERFSQICLAAMARN